MNQVCDIVLPVYNGLSYVKECIASILRCTPVSMYHLYIVNDGSDFKTSQYLSQMALSRDNITLKSNKNNLGYLKSCNYGVRISKSPYVVLLNSDVVVVDGWLEKLIMCAESDSTIGSVNPLTNRASNIDISMTPGASFYTINSHVDTVSQRLYPDVVTGVGFCMLLSRNALEHIGLFDEVYGKGYCEESDLCMRFTQNGYRTVVSNDV